MSEINFCNTKEQLNHLGEVVTGKVDGSPSGADIETSTLPYTGQVRKTLPALEAEYQDDIDNFNTTSDQVITDKTAEFDASIASKESEADAAIDEYRLLNKGPYAAGITLESKFEYITYNGESYFATNPPYTTTAATPDVDGNLFAGGYLTSAQLGASTVTSLNSTEPRSLENRFSDTVKAKDFGALCDGVSDDSDAVEAALNLKSESTVDLGGAKITREIRMLKPNVTITGDLRCSMDAQIYTYYRTRYNHGTVRIEEDWRAPSMFKMSGRHLMNNLGGESEGGRRFYQNFMFNDLIITSDTYWTTSRNWEFTGGLFEWTVGTDFSDNDKNTVGTFFNSISNVRTTCFADFFLKVVFEGRSYGASGMSSVFITDNIISDCSSVHMKNGIVLEADDPDGIGIANQGGYLNVENYSLQSFEGTERFLKNDLAVHVRMKNAVPWDWQYPLPPYTQDPIYCSHPDAVVSMDRLNDFNNGLTSCPNLIVTQVQNDAHTSTYWKDRLKSQGWSEGQDATYAQMKSAFCAGTVLLTNDSADAVPWDYITSTDILEFKSGNRVTVYNSGGNGQNYSFLYECPIDVSTGLSDKKFNLINLVCHTHNLMPFSFKLRTFANSPQYIKVMNVEGSDYFSLTFSIPNSEGNVAQHVSRNMTIKVTPGTSIEQSVDVLTNGETEVIDFPFYWETTGGVTEIFMKYYFIEDSGEPRYPILTSSRVYKNVEFVLEDAGNSVGAGWTAAIDA